MWDDELELWFCGACGGTIDLLWPLRHLAAWSRARRCAAIRPALEPLAAAGPLLGDGPAVDVLRTRLMLPPLSARSAP